MKALVVLAAALWAAPAFAQGTPPMVGGRPLVQVRPKAAPAKPSSIAVRLQGCLEIEDGTKGRLDCYDAIFPPKPAAGKRKPPAAKAVADCRLVKEEDERLACFNGFVERLPRLPRN